MSTPISVSPSELPPFAIGVYARTAPKTPLLDPISLRTAYQAYSAAERVLRSRAGSPLRPGIRHSLANKVLNFAIFGERNPHTLTDRALAHFP